MHKSAFNAVMKAGGWIVAEGSGRSASKHTSQDEAWKETRRLARGAGPEAILRGKDGKGCATDNIWIERFWNSLKYNYIYLNPYDNGLELFDGVQNHIAYYNQKKRQTIKKTPNEEYQESITREAA
jgi:hypothetical protein